MSHQGLRAAAAGRTEIRAMDIGGFLWLIIDVTFVLVFGAALILGIYQWRRRRRSRVTEEVEERAVDRAYED